MFNGRFGAAALIFLLFLLQNFLNYLAPGRVPSLLLIGVIYYSLNQGPRFGMLLGLFAGFLLELFGQGGFGFYMVQLAVLGLLSGFVSSKVFQDSLLAEILLPALAAYGCLLSEAMFMRAAAGESAGWECFVQAFQPWVFVGTAFLAPLLFSRLQRSSDRDRRAWRR